MSAEPTAILSIEGLSKSFGDTHALDGVDLHIQPGQVHSLVGQNGSGKSTLIKIMSGYHEPDAGTIRVRGEEVRPPISGAMARHLGIAFMHQDLALVETRSVMENLLVGRFDTGFGGRVRWRRERANTRQQLAHFGLEVDPRTPVSELSQTQRAIVGVIRALSDLEDAEGSGLLVLDEPTASLPKEEVDLLFAAVRRVTESGASVLFVSHSLEEVLEISDAVSVLRDGKMVAHRSIEEVDQRKLIELILGRALEQMYPSLEEETTGGELLTVRNLSGPTVHDVSFSLRRGEVLGVTGLIGAGHDELPYLIYGASPIESGSIELEGKSLGTPSPSSSVDAGMALLPSDRKGQGSIFGATVRENMTMGLLETFRRHGKIDHRMERRATAEMLRKYDVRPLTPERAFKTLSGGNQQKVLLARWMYIQPRVLLLHEPTQGVDIGARAGIFEILREAANEGMSIIYSSAEHEDLANLCDRVLVFREGQVVAQVASDNMDAHHIFALCYGNDEESSPADPGSPKDP